MGCSSVRPSRRPLRGLLRMPKVGAPPRMLVMIRGGLRAASRSTHVMAAFLAIVAATAAAAGPSVQTRTGPVSGVTQGRVDVFQGIPYAAAPVGDLRWAPPSPRPAWTRLLDASHPGPPCPQVGAAGGIGGVVPSLEEDCLSLNIWRPAGTRPGAALPVIVWFHGGGMQTGTGSLYKGGWLAAHGRPTIVVTINYRLALMGFLALPGLDAEHPELGSGEYGVLDQQAALRWVQGNIRAFGGDPARVTIAGESGGAQSVCVQLASPTARGLFQRAIVESGGCQWRFPSLTASNAKGLQIAEAHGCTGAPAEIVGCMRRIPVGELLPGAPGTGAPSGGPAVGGGVLPLNIRETIAFGRMARVPVMQGANRSEALYYVGPFFDGVGKPVTAEEYPQLLRGFFGDATPAVLERYPLSAYRSPSYAFVAAIGDSGAVFMSRIGACNTLLADRLMAPWTTLYAFDFADPDGPFPVPMFPFPTGGLTGPGHTSELAYLWENDGLTPAQRRLSDVMIAYWTNFAATGDPNGAGLPPWPAFTQQRESVQVLAPGAVRAGASYAAEHNCDFWRQIGFNSLYAWDGDHSPPPPRDRR